MVKEIVRDPIFLSRKSRAANADDCAVADNMRDTLEANRRRCVGMAANMIGESVAIIVFFDGDVMLEMFNPEIIVKKDKYVTEEGCLSLDGVRECIRYKTVKVKWQTRDMKTRIKNFSGFTAEIIQHEIDHIGGILI